MNVISQSSAVPNHRFLRAWLVSLLAYALGVALATAQTPVEAGDEPEPPPVGLELGHVPPEDGITGELPDGTGYHFRLEENRLFVFLLDEEGLIREPDIHTLTLSLVGNMNPADRSTTQFYTTFRAPGRPAFTSSRFIFPPHVFTATLFFFDTDTQSPSVETHFRYTVSEAEAAEIPL